MNASSRGRLEADRPDLSIIVPMLNESANVHPLVKAVRSALGDGDWELLLIDDGSVDGTAEVARAEADAESRIRVIELARRYGQSTAMQAGFDHARGKVVVTMDGDLQNDPLDIPRLVTEFERGYDIVAGYRENRRDKLWTRRLPSQAANWIIGKVTGRPVRDSGCTLKAYRRELLDRMRLYAELHRFIPAMAVCVAGARISEIPVRHHARVHGESKYGLFRIFQVVTDLLTISMIRSFRFRPFTMYARAAAVCAVAGLASAVSAVVADVPDPAADNLVVLSGIALLMFALALYLVMLGLIGEVAVRTQGREMTRKSPLIHEITRY